VGEFIRENFVSAFQKVATFRIVNGQKQGGNVASYFCAPDGRVLHAIAGPVDAGTFMREARWVVDGVRTAMADAKRSGLTFKAMFRRWHAARLRAEHGMIVEPVTFDPPAPAESGEALSYRDPSGQLAVTMLPAPPLDGPDVTFNEEEQRKASTEGAPAMPGRGRKVYALSNAGRVHALLAAHAMARIERLYGTVFESILGERITTQPVVAIGALPGRTGEVCLHCQSKVGAARDGD
jgi:hypothetical protein